MHDLNAARGASASLGPARDASELGVPRQHLDQRANDAQAGQPQVLKRPRLADGIQERVQEHRDVRCACTLPLIQSSLSCGH